MDIESLICSHIRDVELCEPPDWQRLAARAGVTVDQLIRLDTNENPYGPSSHVRDALGRCDEYEFYPDYRDLTAAIARYAGVDPLNIFLGNGGDEVIDLLVRLFVEPGEGVVICPPAFVSYSISTTAHRGQLLEVPRQPDFGLDLGQVERLVAHPGERARAKLVFLTSPGNPDGLAIPLDAIRRLLELPLAVVVDEAYVEYGGQTAVPLLAAHRNLIVLRTFSKWAGMAGLRLGYAIAAPEVAAAAEHIRPVYNINTAAVVAALATLDDMDGMAASIKRVVSERARLEEELAGLPGVHPIPSQANFVFCRIDGHTGQELADALAAQGILVRSFSAPELADAVRITVGRPRQNDAVLAALRNLLSGINRVGTVRQPSITAAGVVREPPSPTANVTPPATRRGSAQRQTRETDVAVTLDLDGTGRYQIDTGLGFLDHMLAQVAAHGLFDLTVRARGDLAVDEHHTVEDVAIGLGRALDAALADRRGIVRMGQAYAPLDEALAHVVIDLSGRPYAVVEAEFGAPRIGAVGTDLIVHFLETLASQARMALHARVLYGRNDHHKAEALFKALGRALDMATCLDPRRAGPPSTKGVL